MSCRGNIFGYKSKLWKGFCGLFANSGEPLIGCVISPYPKGMSKTNKLGLSVIFRQVDVFPRHLRIFWGFFMKCQYVFSHHNLIMATSVEFWLRLGNLTFTMTRNTL